MSTRPTPCPALVDKIAAEEAHKAGIGLTEIKKPYLARRYSRPRKQAFVRIINATGCTPYGLAQVWGCDPQSVRRAMLEAGVSSSPAQTSVRVFGRAA